ncbi:hybrid sensor histidine kinase/response regulator [Leptospira idonii]|uniref:histidine kinase n=1 Tax=Leptospira idonii TaxID=1193500 RepID=A0A4R9M1Z1_9LEPT|nr:ATP-binding protein [Leptospira idonii]TGN19971.1 response regulator [Leptospira idonii]
MIDRRKIQILIIEDSKFAYDTVLDILNMGGWDVYSERVEWKKDLDEALKKRAWDLVITDYYLADFTGKTAIEMVHSMFPDLPVILITEFVGEEMATEMFRWGAADFILKSNINKLAYVVEREFESYIAKKQQKQAWEMLVHSEEMLTRSQSLAKLGHFEIVYPEKRILWSLELYKILGYSYGEIPSEEKFFDRVAEDDRLHLIEIWDKAKTEDKQFELELKLRLPHASKFARLTLECENLSNGQSRYFGTIHDTSNYNALESAIRHNEQLFKGIFNNSSQVILLLDLDGRVLKMNRISVSLLEREEREIQGSNFIDSLFSQVNKEIQKQFRQGIMNANQKRSTELFATYISPSGKTIFLDCDISAVTDPMGDVMYLVLEGKDITEKIELERSYAQAQKMEALGTFAGGISHDFNNLLTPMFNFVSYLQAEWEPLREDPERKRTFFALDGLMKSLERAKALISQILDFSKKDAVSLVEVDLHSSLNSIFAELRKGKPFNGDFAMNLSESKALVQADPNFLYQVFSNLYENAHFALAESRSPKIQISTKKVWIEDTNIRNIPSLKTTYYWEVEFKDNGSGIPKDLMGKIFEPFFTTKGRKGTGLGLPIIYGVMRRMGGVMTVDSQPGNGTSFYCYFPAWESLA